MPHTRTKSLRWCPLLLPQRTHIIMTFDKLLPEIYLQIDVQGNRIRSTSYTFSTRPPLPSGSSQAIVQEKDLERLRETLED
jgi:hypothetical protein